MVDRAPQIVSLPTDLHEDLIQMPLPLRRLPHSFRTALPYFVSEVSSKTVDPMPHRLVADVDATFVKKVFDVPQGQREADIHHNRKLDDLGRRLEVAEWILAHFRSLSSRMRRLKAGSFDNPRVSAADGLPHLAA